MSTEAVGSILFTDLVGFTEYNDTVGDGAAVAALDQQAGLVADSLRDHAGARVVKELGDGLMIWFDRPGCSIAASIALLDAVAAARSIDGFPLAMRMGLHHGPAIPRGQDLVGRTINVAARVADLAGPGELLVTEAALAAAPPTPDLITAEVGPVRVKGVEAPVWILRVERVAAGRR